jgi:hypothetical protein
VDGFQDKPTIEAPGEGAEVARQMFGRDGAVGGQEAVFDVPLTIDIQLDIEVLCS